MDVAEFRLQRLEAEYQAVIAAGEKRPAEEPGYVAIPDSDSDSFSEPVPVSTPEVIATAPSPLSESEVTLIKTQMAAVRLKYTPSWAHAVSDEALLQMCRKASSD